jgi:P27 family predicted phage terminase small subunit
MSGNSRSGRRRKPTALKVIEGNRGHRPLPEGEPQPEVGMPAIPAELDADAVAKWNEVAPELFAVGVLTLVDGSALAAYCSAWSTWVKAQRRLNAQARNDDTVFAEGLLQRTKSGNIIQNPLLGIANVARRDMLRAAAELGLTPAARANLEGAKRGDEDPTDKKFFGGRA